MALLDRRSSNTRQLTRLWSIWIFWLPHVGAWAKCVGCWYLLSGGVAWRGRSGFVGGLICWNHSLEAGSSPITVSAVKQKHSQITWILLLKFKSDLMYHDFYVGERYFDRVLLNRVLHNTISIASQNFTIRYQVIEPTKCPIYQSTLTRWTVHYVL